MKQLFFIVAAFIIVQTVSAQSEGPKEVTPEVLQKIKSEVELMVPAFKKKLATQDLTPEEVEFSLDTFRIEQIVSKRMDIDYSSVGMLLTVNDMTKSYDKLMNRYYNKLLKILKPEDKKVLIAAQKAWIAFRDAESRLIALMSQEQYSGGGSIQANIAVSAYNDLVENRTGEIFNYYDRVIKDK